MKRRPKKKSELDWAITACDEWFESYQLAAIAGFGQITDRVVRAHCFGRLMGRGVLEARPHGGSNLYRLTASAHWWELVEELRIADSKLRLSDDTALTLQDAYDRGGSGSGVQIKVHSGPLVMPWNKF